MWQPTRLNQEHLNIGYLFLGIVIYTVIRWECLNYLLSATAEIHLLINKVR